MFSWLKRQPREETPLPAIPPGQRVYAIGDIHGRVDLLTDMLRQIWTEVEFFDPADFSIILLGDLIDRGPNSRKVVDLVARHIAEGWPIRAIMGNHEEVLLSVIGGDAASLPRFLQMGGIETLQSYGIDIAALDDGGEEAALALIDDAIPIEHQRFLAGMEDMIAIGDYLFVHAGIRPDLPLDEQTPGDLRWIRKPFLGHRQSFGPMIVHGHSIRTSPDLRANRLGIDTGAYRTGKLTALVLEGTERRILQTTMPHARARKVQTPR